MRGVGFLYIYSARTKSSFFPGHLLPCWAASALRQWHLNIYASRSPGLEMACKFFFSPYRVPYIRTIQEFSSGSFLFARIVRRARTCAFCTPLKALYLKRISTRDGAFAHPIRSCVQIAPLYCGLKIKLNSGHCDTAIIVEATAVS